MSNIPTFTTLLFCVTFGLILYTPIETWETCNVLKLNSHATCFVCTLHKALLNVAALVGDLAQHTILLICDVGYLLKLKIYKVIEMLDSKDLCNNVCCREKYTNAKEDLETKVDRLIEDEITNRLSDNLFESLEIKFYDDLSKSLNVVLLKIKVLLQNGTNQIQDGLDQLQNELEIVKQRDKEGTHHCLTKMENKTLSLADDVLHQMILCAYALIGHDPAKAILKVVQLKKMIQDTLKPLHKQNVHINSLLKVCGHSHESLHKVIRCVVSKSPILKSTMLEITENLIQGAVDLTKLVSHGAMHEACLIEVIKSAEDGALEIVKDAKLCQSKSLGNETKIDNMINKDDENNEVMDVNKESSPIKRNV